MVEAETPSSSQPQSAQLGASGALNSTQDRLRSINCSQCSAPITLLGGHKVLSITCSYCGSELDAKDEYKLIRKFDQRARPVTPIELGMTGKFKGVEFTVIALVQYRTTDNYGWLEFALYSPTHGYAWLEQVDNHFLFSRRTRDLPGTPPRPQIKSTFKVHGRTYSMFEHYTASIIYVEGELTFIARKGDRVRTSEAISPPFIYSIERTAYEEEYVLGEYIDPQEVYAALNIGEDVGKRYTVHPAQPYVPSPFISGLSKSGLYFMPVVALILLVILWFGWGNTILQTRFDTRMFHQDRPGSQPQSKVFQVKDAGKLLELKMHSPLNNAWAAYDIQVHKGAKPVFSMAKQLSYYSGYDGGEYWSEGTRSASAYFKVPDTGEYKLVIKAQGGSGRSRRPPPTHLRVTVNEGIVVSRYFFCLFVVLALAFAAKWVGRWRFESRRWGDTEDDD